MLTTPSDQKMLDQTDISDPSYFHKVVDCQWACPAHTPVPEYIRMIAAGDYADAYMVNWKSNVFPGILGRTCDRPCEPACRRGRVEEEPVAICRLKRVAADYKGDIRARLPSVPAVKNGKRIACIGGGPASFAVARDLAPLGYDVTIFDGARIGKNSKIFPTAVISADSQDLKYNGEKTTAEIGDNTIIREAVTIHKGTADRWKTVIGNNCLLMAYVHVAHDCIIGNNVIIANATGLSGHITIDDFAVIEGMVGGQQFTHVGMHAFVGGTSRIRKDVPPFIKVAKEPLSYIGVNSIGLKRRGYSEESIRRIEDIYRILFIQNKNISKGSQIVQNEIQDCEEKTIVLDFIKNSKNGLIKGLQ